jgi:hypothetical protein
MTDETPAEQNTPPSIPGYEQHPDYFKPNADAYGGYPSPQPLYPPLYIPQAPAKGFSITAMVLGLVSIVVGFTFVVPAVGLILGIVGLKKEPAGRGMAITGIIVSGIVLAFWAILVGFIIAAAIATAGSAASYSVDGY